MTPASPERILAFEGVTVDFPGVRALDAVSFEVAAHQVHALMGENGAGKSTLLRVLAGVQAPSAGGLRVAGRAVSFQSAADALEAGIAVIYQELNLVPQMTVAENLLLGHLPARGGFLIRRRLQEQARAVLAELGEDIEPGARVASLPLGQRQMVEIGKALLRRARIIAFDEPTSALSARESSRLAEIIARLRNDGCAIIYVTHRMEEVFALCDAVTVFRDGKCVACHPQIRALAPGQLVRDMVGRDIADVYGYRARPAGDVILEVRNLLGSGLSAPVSFTVRRGEIVGFFGLIGAGRTELMRLVAGAAQPSAGEVRFRGRAVRYKSPRQAIDDGIALCPEDRKQEGIFPLASVADNLNISVRRRQSYGGGWLNRAREAALADRYIAQLDIRTPGRETPIARLSGGNQQKTILARWLAQDVELLIVDEPTRGIDVGARAQIYATLYELAAAGKAIIVVSSDLAEIASISDRIAVMREGALVGSVERATATAESLLAMALPR